MKRFKIIFLLLLFVGIDPVLASELEIPSSLQDAANNGDASAQFKVAELYEMHYIDNIDLFADISSGNDSHKKAVTWYEAAANQGHEYAQYTLVERAYHYSDKEDASKWLKLAMSMAEDNGKYAKYAQYRLGKHFYLACLGKSNTDRNKCENAAKWYTELLVGTEKKVSGAYVPIKAGIYFRKVTLSDVRANLIFAKKLAKSSNINKEINSVSSIHDLRPYAEKIFFDSLNNLQLRHINLDKIRYNTTLYPGLRLRKSEIAKLLVNIERRGRLKINKAQWGNVTNCESVIELIHKTLKAK